MSLTSFMSKTGLLLLLLASSVCCSAGRQEVTGLDGGMLEAGAIAVGSFASSIKNDAKTELDVFSGSVKNYNVTVKVEDASYDFTFELKPYHGRLLKGGGAFYKIDKKEYRVVEEKHFK